jgi:hypothetical protein
MDLQAEIWRWTPETDTWERVYQAPKDVEIQGTDPVKYTARDIGYRGMTVFKEADGTEALYAAGVTTRATNDGKGFAGWVPAPRILRSTDGVNFEALPHDPGTFLGDNLLAGFRTFLTYKHKLYVVGSVGQLGQGILLEAEHPEEGNNAFRQVSPDGMAIFEIETYNGFLWAGTGSQPLGHYIPHPFALLKTNATGAPPYAFTPVIPEDGHRKSPAVISMHEFKGRLFVGTDREVFRVNPDDSWDMVVGAPWLTGSGRKLEPFSGFGLGFDSWFFNIHMWRMGSHDGTLYISTHDQTTKWRIAGIGPLVKDRMGCDLYASTDGWHFSMVTRKGFGDIFNNGLRNFVSTPSNGFFIGTANLKGTWIYQGVRNPSLVDTPERLEVESGLKSAVLSWAGSPSAVRFHVYRDSGFTDPREIGVTKTPADRVFVDKKIVPFKVYHYYVVAEDKDGNLSDPSNMVRIPFKGPVPSFKSLRASLKGLQAPAVFSEQLSIAQAEVVLGNYTKALAALEIMRVKAQNPLVLKPWQGDDLDVLLVKFIRRVNLAQAGALSPLKLML